MSKKARKSGRGKFRLDLSSIDDYVYTLQEAPNKIMSELSKVAHKFGSETEQDYASRISYANGFKTKLSNTRTFNNVESDSDKFRINVGHTGFVAKFAEVGTKAHAIPHKTRNGKMITANVRGQTGSKALYKAFNRNNGKVGDEISKAITNILSGK